MRYGWMAALTAMSLFQAESAVAANDRYYSLTIAGKHVGYERSHVEKVPEGRKTVTDNLVKLSLLGTPGEQSTQAITITSPDGRPIRYSATIRALTQVLSLDYRFSKGWVKVTASLPGAPEPTTLKWGPDCVLFSDNLDDTAKQLLEMLGRSERRMIRPLHALNLTLDPLPLTRGKAETVKVFGKSRPCEVLTVGAGPLALVYVVAKDSGEVLEYRIPAQQAVFRLSDRTAMEGIQNYEALTRAFALSDVTFEDPAALKTVKVRVKAQIGAEKITAETLRSPKQRFTGTVKDGLVDGTLEIHALTYAGENSPAFRGGSVRGNVPVSLAPYLKAERQIEADDPEIVALAQRLTEGSKTDWEAVKRIGDWVFKNITYTITGAGAKICLREKKGDCGPHTMLTIALCRAAGIPARMAGGALYSNLMGGSFGQHYWTRVWMGPKDGWVPIDTTTGEIGTFSPTHLTFWNRGGIGSLMVKVLDYSPKASAAASAGLQSARTTIPFHAGDKERYLFTVLGEPSGEQTAECLSVDASGTAAWKYALHLSIPPPSGSGEPTRVDNEGQFTVTSAGAPVGLSLSVKGSGITQAVKYRFNPEKIGAVISIGGNDMKRDISWTGKESLLLNNVMTTVSIITRGLRLEPGQKANVSILLAEAFQKLNATFVAAEKTEKAAYGGMDVQCVVLEIKEFGNRVYVSRETGELLKLTDLSGKFSIERK